MALTPTAPAPISAQKPGVVMSAAYADGRRVSDVNIEDAGEWARRPGHLVWIGLYEPSAELLGQVQTQFGLHPLAIEDAQTAHQRPKLERYGDCLFVVARTAQIAQGRIALGETHLFIGRGFVVTVRHGTSVSYSPVREKTESCPKLLAHGEDYILYAVLDFIVDNYAPVMETVLAEVEGIEDCILKRELRPDEVERLYLLRRDLLRLRTAVVPLVEVCRKLEHGDMVAIDDEMQPLFRDVSDHLRRVQDEIDAVREVLAFAFEASLMLGQAQQTVITRRLAAWAAILAVPTAIAGIYGMNFEHMPELKWEYGYLLVLGGIFAVCAVLYWRFRKNGWL
ncbi:magnesium and cobalt transport protein CorA [Methylobacterium oryzisoli]|uniref:magnesium and cobalt transport protein CorA n=1 Tax=Methylobacterium oryzisoli TaxID=3385502 RepID=UPI003891C228